MNNHLDESDFDIAIRNTGLLDGAKALHLGTCSKCSRYLENAKRIQAGLNALPKPVLGFDLVALVMPQLQPSIIEENKIAILVQLFIWLTVAGFIGACIYFKDYFSAFKIEFKDSALPLILMPIVFYMVWQIADMLRVYFKSISQLKIS